MASEYLTEPQTPPAGQVERLDIYKDCLDLKNRFPSNVDLKFIYWRHGDRADEESGFDKGYRIGGYLRESEVIALEVAESASDPVREIVERDLNCLNSLNSIDDPKLISYEDIYKNEGFSAQYRYSLGILARLGDEGRERLPIFVPIYDNKSGELPEHKPGTPVFTEAANFAESNRQREGLALRTIHDLADELARTKGKHELGILYGSHHTMISVAARALGANTKRTFIDKPPFSPARALERQMRFTDHSKWQDLDPAPYELAEDFGYETFELASKVMPDVTIEACVRLARLGLMYYTDRLPKHKNLAVKQDLTALSPFLNKGEMRLPRKAKRHVALALRSLINLSLDVDR